MKTLALLFALSLYLLLPSPAHSTFNPIRLRTADVGVASGAPVRDSDGEELQAGGVYYITSITWGAGAGEVKLEWKDPNSKCASDVMSGLEADPIVITPADPNATAVLQSTYQSFKFNVATNFLCVGHVYWGIQYDSASGQYFVRADEFVSNQSNLFKIELVPPTTGTYQITYCPAGTDKCYYVGRYYDPSVKATRLALSDFPFMVLFKKAGSVAQVM